MEKNRFWVKPEAKKQLNNCCDFCLVNWPAENFVSIQAPASNNQYHQWICICGMLSSKMRRFWTLFNCFTNGTMNGKEPTKCCSRIGRCSCCYMLGTRHGRAIPDVIWSNEHLWTIRVSQPAPQKLKYTFHERLNKKIQVNVVHLKLILCCMSTITE